MIIKSERQIQHNRVINHCLNWLAFIALAHIIGGFSLSFGWPDALWGEYQNELLRSFNLEPEDVNRTENLINMLSRLLGPTIASWGILMLYTVRKIKVDKRNQDIHFLATATLVWFCMDTYISFNFGMMLHVLINTAALMAILIPLLIIGLSKER